MWFFKSKAIKELEREVTRLKKEQAYLLSKIVEIGNLNVVTNTNIITQQRGIEILESTRYESVNKIVVDIKQRIRRDDSVLTVSSYIDESY